MTTEGSIEFLLKPINGAFNWYGDSNDYDFPRVGEKGIEITSHKDSNRILSLSVRGIRPNIVELSAPVPRCPESGLFVVITWTATRINLLFNGKLAQQLDISF